MFKKILKIIYSKVFHKSLTSKDYLLSHGLKVGSNTSIYSWDWIDANFPWLICIGDNTIVSTCVSILAHDASTNIVKCNTKVALTKIGNNCFLGTKSIVLCGVTIQDNVIVGAGSVVTHDLESGYVYAGNPARKVCTIEEFKKKRILENNERPNFSFIRHWDDWANSTEEERQQMVELLSDGCGYI